ncbi:MAG TPA: DUF4167 domain-containing protein [Microvirga sp.]|nr:DUF4167 domain-containing protein [Microvirga sp.]
MRGRNRNNKGPNPLTRSYESNGPDVKIRGTAQHIAEKYSQLARDALASGDPVAAENYFQHAEHYFRIIAAAQEQLREQFGFPQRFDEEGEEETGFAFGDDADLGSQPQPFESRQDRSERMEGERQPRFDRGERQERGERRERFQRDRGPRQDFQRGEGEPRQERGDRPDRGEFRRERRRDENEAEGAGLPAFLTTPVRPPLAVSGEDAESPAPAAENGVNGEANGEFRTRRRRRRTRFGSDDTGAETAEFAPEVIDTPAAE